MSKYIPWKSVQKERARQETANPSLEKTWGQGPLKLNRAERRARGIR